MQKSSSTIPIVAAVLLVLCCCLIIAASGIYMVAYRLQDLLPTLMAYPRPAQYLPTPTFFEITRQPLGSSPADTLHLLEQTDIPINDYPDLACRLKEICNVPSTLQPPAAPRQAGEQDRFWVTNQTTTESFQVTATLRYVTPHAYFWVENGVQARDQAIRELTDTFEDKIYPTDRAFFGSEWTLGIDGDVHIYILYTHGLGNSIAGLFSSDDEYNPLIRQYSNGHEMFQINSETVSVGESYTYSTLAHEFQHMIEWNQDRNEPPWMSEGAAELASFLNGYDTGGFDSLFLFDPDMQLNNWPNDPSNPAADFSNYGASFLFMAYFLDRFGEPATQTLVREPLNGLEGMDQTLSDIHATDPQTGQPIRVEDFFLDWAITNYLQDASAGDGRYIYHNYPGAPQAGQTETIATCPVDTASRTVHQYGTDYIYISCPGTYSLSFTGATSTRLLPADPHSGDYAFWSNKGDSSNMSLTHEFDFTNVSAPIPFSYWTWYDIEKDWDYLYLEASTDGRHWQFLITPSGTANDPTGSSFGWGITGGSDGWKQETVDLSRFAGQKVTLRFDYVTDLAVNGEGFLLDDVSIPAINYSSDFETDDGGWVAEGFARVQNILPQTFRLALITHTAQGANVEIIPVAADQTADIPLTIGQDGVNAAVLVVTGTTRFTRDLAAYQFSIR